MGFNSWYALHHHLTANYTWEDGYILADDVYDIAAYMRTYGFYDLGYTYINLDGCIVAGRDATTQRLIPDPRAFPQGQVTVTNLSQSLHQMGFKFGWYTDRGVEECGSRGYQNGFRRPGSLGFESVDAQTFADWGVDYLKEDSCFSNSAPYGMVQQYARMRDALNRTGRPIYFSLCNPEDGPATAQVGASLGNSWRVAVDVGSGWNAVLENVEVDNQLGHLAGPGHWNDPGLLLAGSNALTSFQGRTQFSLWSILASKLLISVDPRTLDNFNRETYLNREVIAINQDVRGIQGRRVQKDGAAEVWLRPLQHGAYALLFFNNGAPGWIDISCHVGVKGQVDDHSDDDCLPATSCGMIRDVWAHQDLYQICPGESIVMNKVLTDDSRMLVFRPSETQAMESI